MDESTKYEVDDQGSPAPDYDAIERRLRESIYKMVKGGGMFACEITPNPGSNGKYRLRIINGMPCGDILAADLVARGVSRVWGTYDVGWADYDWAHDVGVNNGWAHELYAAAFDPLDVDSDEYRTLDRNEPRAMAARLCAYGHKLNGEFGR